MLPIPSSLLNKLKSLKQTVGYNADPHMDVLAQKAAKYLNQGSFLTPRTVRTGNSLGPLDICLRRENFNAEPTEIVMLYIEDGVAKVATLPYVHTPDQNFTYQYTVGPATDVACDFDGRWNYILDRTGLYFDTQTVWALQTFGEPYFALVNGGALNIWQGTTPIITLVNENVLKCSMLRGFKSVNHVLTDQGIICAYIKTDNKAYYRAYCEQEDGSFIWEMEHEIAEFVTPVTNLGIFRTADYRTGFLAEIEGNIQLLLTVRSWSGMASPHEFISASVSGATITVTEIYYGDYQNPDEYITAGADATVISFGGTMPVLMDAWNYDDGNGDYGKFIMVRWNDSVAGIESNLSAFKIVDDYNVSYYPSAIYKTDYGNRLILEFADFNNAANPISVVYTPGTLVWKDGAAISASSVDFNATGLVPTYIPAPVVTNIASVDNRTILITFDRPIISIDPGIGLTVTGFEPFASPAGQLIPTTYGIESITAYDDYTVQIYLTYAGRMKHPQGDVTILYTNGLTGPGPTAVAGFSQGFTPTGLTLWFKPNDPEYITIAPIATITVFDVTYKSGKNGDEYLKAGAYNATITITNVGGLPL